MRFPGKSLLAWGILVAAATPIVLAFDVAPDQDRLWAQFRQPVMFGDKLLPEGRYLFVHDDAQSAMMEPCLSVYRETELDEPLAAVHCIRRTHKPSERNKIVWGSIRRDSVKEFGYIQFAGDAFAHYTR